MEPENTGKLVDITAPFGDVNYLGQEEPDRAYPAGAYTRSHFRST